MRVRRVSGTLLPPIVFGVLFVAVWQFGVRAGDVSKFTLPAPSDIWSSFGDAHSRIVSAALYTGLNALVGLLVYREPVA